MPIFKKYIRIASMKRTGWSGSEKKIFPGRDKCTKEQVQSKFKILINKGIALVLPIKTEIMSQKS